MAIDNNDAFAMILKRLDELERGQEILYEQMEALMNLHALLAPLNAPLPPMRKWAISPDFGILLYSLLQEYQPTTVAELGGGVSTVITGYYFAQNEGEGVINAFDHHPLFAELARKQIEMHQMIDVATVFDAPLKPVRLAGEAWNWYDTHAFDKLSNVDFLTIDGPPQQDNPNRMARYPALPVLFDKLNSGAIILMDDTHREDETNIVERWLTEFDIVKVNEVDNQKGAVILQKK